MGNNNFRTPNKGLVGIDIADTSFGFEERNEFGTIMSGNLDTIDTALGDLEEAAERTSGIGLVAYVSYPNAAAPSLFGLESQGILAITEDLSEITVTPPPAGRTMAISFAVGWDGGDIEIFGTGFDDEPLSEVFPAGDGTEYQGWEFFKTITSITKTLVGSGFNSTTIGIGNKFRIPGNPTIFLQLTANGVAEAPADSWVGEVPYFEPTTTPNGLVDFIVTYGI